MTIYIDVLLAVNLYINYFLIRGTSVMLRRDTSSGRCLLAAAAGSFFSLIIMFPELPVIVTAVVKLISCAVIVVIAFGLSEKTELVINALSFAVISFVYAGLMMGLWSFAAPLGMYFRNGIAYFDIPLIAVGLFTMIAYGIIRFMRYIIDRKVMTARFEEITLRRNGIAVTLKGLADTGNSLTDPFTGAHAIICTRASITEIIPENVSEYLDKGLTPTLTGIKLIPCSTINGTTVIPVFNADEAMIHGKSVKAVIGVSNHPIEGADCLFNPGIIP